MHFLSQQEVDVIGEDFTEA